MLSSTARPLAARVARRAAIVGQPARCSSQLTTTPSDGAKSKEEERPAQQDAAKPTIFDLKIETPINKNSEWNISFAPEQAGESPARGQSMRDFRNSRYPPRGATTAGRPIRLPPSNLFSSLAVDRKPFAQTEPLFVSDRWCDEIEDEARTREILSKLHAEADKPAKQKLAPSATYFPGNHGTHFLPSLDKLPNDIYFRIGNKARLRVGIEAGIKRTRDHEQPRRALPPSASSSATSGGIPYWYYYP